MPETDNNPAASPSVPTSIGSESAKTDGREQSKKAQTVADDAGRAPEEENESRIPGDPRPPHEMQPPTGDQY